VVLLKEYDAQMKRFTWFADYDLLTIDEWASAFSDFEILRLEVVDVTPEDEPQEGGPAPEGPWTAGLLYGRKPVAKVLK